MASLGALSVVHKQAKRKRVVKYGDFICSASQVVPYLVQQVLIMCHSKHTRQVARHVRLYRHDELCLWSHPPVPFFCNWNYPENYTIFCLIRQYIVFYIIIWSQYVVFRLVVLLICSADQTFEGCLFCTNNTERRSHSLSVLFR